jgi:hypothetical protein
MPLLQKTDMKKFIHKPLYYKGTGFTKPQNNRQIFLTNKGGFI